MRINMSQYTNFPNQLSFFDDSLERVINAIETFFKLDSYLIKNDLHEGTMAHRLAIYLDEIFVNYNVDCEWNKNQNKTKRIFTHEIIELVKKALLTWESENKNNEIKNENIVAIRELQKILIKKEGHKPISIKNLEGDELFVLNDWHKKNIDKPLIVKNIRPDIVIHHRGTKNNHIAIEAKKEKGPRNKQYMAAKSFDLIKLHQLTNQANFEYSYGIYVEFPKSKRLWKDMNIRKSNFLKFMFPNQIIKVFVVTFV